MTAAEHRVPGGTVRLRLIGILDDSVTEALGAAVTKAQDDADGGLVLLDFAELELLSVAAAHVLIAAETRYRSLRGRVVVQHVPPAIDDTLRAAGLGEAFEILDAACDPAPLGAWPLQAFDSVLVQGEMSPLTALMVERAIRRVTEYGIRPVIVDLREVTVPTGPVMTMLCAALRRCGHFSCPVTVLGAPLQLALTLGVEANGARVEPPLMPWLGRSEDS